MGERECEYVCVCVEYLHRRNSWEKIIHRKVEAWE